VWADEEPVTRQQPRVRSNGPAPTRAPQNGGGRGRPPGGGPTRRPAPRRRRRTPIQKTLLGVGILAIIALLAVAAGLVYTLFKFNSIDRVDVELASAGVSEPQNFLLVGSDTRDIAKDTPDAGGIFGKGDEAEHAGQRADTILIARVDPARTSVELLSIPRDLWIDLPEGKEGRINATYNKGAQPLIDAIQKNLGVEINHYVEVNFESFKGLVEVIGGVPMYFDRPMYDENTGLAIRKKGCYNLDPVQALAFARSRHLMYSNGVKWVADPTADMGRITRQQVFLRHALAKIGTLGIGDVNTMRRLIDVAVENVKVDDQLGAGQMLALGKKFAKFDAKTLVTHRLPTTARTTNGGAAILEMDGTASTPVLDIFRGKTEPKDADAGATATTSTVPNASVTVDVLNGVGTAGLAKEAADELVAVSFNRGEVGDAPAAEVTTISYPKGARAKADAVARHLSTTPKLVEDTSLTSGHVRLVLGQDFDGVAAKPAGGAASAQTSTTVADPSAASIGFVTGDPPPGEECNPT
jgi:LCP family protein required for cell wall assembly